jgi:DNA topoisomerase-3
MKIDVLASPEMTGDWEYKLNQIMKGELTRETFMRDIRQLTRHIISQISTFDKTEIREEAPFSPINGIRFFSSPTAYHSEDKKLVIRKILGGRVMQNDEIAALIRGETIGPFVDFRSKKGKTFSASVRIVANKVEFIFANSADDLNVDTVKSQPSLGKSPIDSTDVYDTPAVYMSASALDGDDKKGLKIGKTILSKEITPLNVTQLLTQGRTELIKGFISKKRRPFDAYLLLAKNGKISFEFPPRKPKQAKSDNS